MVKTDSLLFSRVLSVYKTVPAAAVEMKCLDLNKVTRILAMHSHRWRRHAIHHTGNRDRYRRADIDMSIVFHWK